MFVLFFIFIEIIKKYSNFVGFPIFLNGVCINTVEVKSYEVSQNIGLICYLIVVFVLIPHVIISAGN